jgi:citrate lyase beta subunit
MSQHSERVRRAILFTPGDSLPKIEKGASLGADSLILDLEDGCALANKESARGVIVHALSVLQFGRSERLVRINPFETGLGRADLETTLPARPDGVVLPKVEAAAQVQEVSALISAEEARRGWPQGSIRLLVFIETARGMMNLREIAGSDPRLDALLFGAEDLASSIGATRTRSGEEIAYARSMLVLGAAAFDLQAIDTVYVDLHDIEGLTAESHQALRLGFSGKLAIHPRQVVPITAAFTPTHEAVDRARRLIEAFRAAQAGGSGVLAFEGKMVDMPMLRAAERVLARADAAGRAET